MIIYNSITLQSSNVSLSATLRIHSNVLSINAPFVTGNLSADRSDLTFVEPHNITTSIANVTTTKTNVYPVDGYMQINSDSLNVPSFSYLLSASVQSINANSVNANYAKCYSDLEWGNLPLDKPLPFGDYALLVGPNTSLNIFYNYLSQMPVKDGWRAIASKGACRWDWVRVIDDTNIKHYSEDNVPTDISIADFCNLSTSSREIWFYPRKI